MAGREYQGLVRTAFDPEALADLNVLASLHPEREWGSDAPWPYATEERWSYYRADRAWHRSFDLVLPMTDVPADWFVPMLLEGDVTRTVSMTLKGVPRQQACGGPRALTHLQAEEERKRKLGQLHTAEDDKRQTAAERRMRELADGHAVLVCAVTVTVTAPTWPPWSGRAGRWTAWPACPTASCGCWRGSGNAWTPLARGLE